MSKRAISKYVCCVIRQLEHDELLDVALLLVTVHPQ